MNTTRRLRQPVRSTTLALAAATTLTLLAGCAGGPHGRSFDMPPPQTAQAPAAGMAAKVRLMDTQGRTVGEATLTDVAGGVQLDITTGGLTPGEHGFHIHTNGACAPGPDAATGQTVAFGAAGGHFDPGMAHKHGQPGEPATVAHAGELPNLRAGADGRTTLRYVNANVTVATGPRSVMGRSLIVHEKPDDYRTDPAGNSGGRVLCGTIGPA